MLIRFRVSNFLSFRDEVELSMIPGRTRQHPDHIVRGDGRNDVSILRGALIYGPNASGKSNLIKAIAFARELILDGVKPAQAIARTPFKLDRDCLQLPSKFEFEIRQNERCYVYGFEIDSQRVHAEWLYEIKKTTESLLFERRTDEHEKTSVEFGSIEYVDKEEREFLRFIARGKGMRSNQLFLTESIERDVMQFKPVSEWFREKLVVIFPHSQYIPLSARVREDQALSDFLVRNLEKLGTGICGFELNEVPAEGEIPEEIINDVIENVKEKAILNVWESENSRRYLLSVDPEQGVRIFKLMLKHSMAGCEEKILLDMDEESDGTLRLLNLLPSLYSLNKERVFVIDELDRSLHPSLSYEIVRLFLQDQNSMGQIIATTHEAGLLAFDLLRRDEIWFIEKDQNGASHLYSLEEFTPRYDRDIEKGYLMGRFGAIPILGKVSF